MDLQLVQAALGWAALINIAVLVLWWLLLSCARDWLYRTHRRWFPLSDEQFNQMHYQLYGQYKIGNLLLFITPYLALRIVN